MEMTMGKLKNLAIIHFKNLFERYYMYSDSVYLLHFFCTLSKEEIYFTISKVIPNISFKSFQKRSHKPSSKSLYVRNILESTFVQSKVTNCPNQKRLHAKKNPAAGRIRMTRNVFSGDCCMTKKKQQKGAKARYCNGE